jgi:hypothetical protein
MMGRMRSTLVLLLIFAVLFGYFWTKERNRKPPETTNTDIPKVEDVTLTSGSLTDYSEVWWRYASVSARLKRSDNEWKVPDISLKTDTDKAKTFVGTLTNLKGQRKYSTKELKLSDVGLDMPFYTLTLKRNDGKEEMVKVGKKTVDNDYYYAMKDGSDVITLLSSYTVDELEHDQAYFKFEPTPVPSSTP